MYIYIYIIFDRNKKYFIFLLFSAVKKALSSTDMSRKKKRRAERKAKANIFFNNGQVDDTEDKKNQRK
jgi:hypothetical protein